MSESRDVRAAIMAASRITGPEAIVAMVLMQEFSDSENATVKAENTRLREALELITSADCNCPGACDRCIAVEALENSK